MAQPHQAALVRHHWKAGWPSCRALAIACAVAQNLTQNLCSFSACCLLTCDSPSLIKLPVGYTLWRLVVMPYRASLCMSVCYVHYHVQQYLSNVLIWCCVLLPGICCWSPHPVGEGVAGADCHLCQPDLLDCRGPWGHQVWSTRSQGVPRQAAEPGQWVGLYSLIYFFCSRHSWHS